MPNNAKTARVENYCALSGYERAKSRLTGVEVIHNLSETAFLIHPEWMQVRAEAALQSWELTKRYRTLRYLRFRNIFSAANVALRGARTIALFVEELEKLMKAVVENECDRSELAHSRPVLMDLLFILWTHECVIWPRTHLPLPGWRRFAPSLDWGKATSLMSLMSARISGPGDKKGQRVKFFGHLLTSSSIVSDVRDICPTATPVVWTTHRADFLTHIVKEVIAEQRAAQNTGEHYKATEFVVGPTKRVITSEPEFAWASAAGDRIRLWQQDARAFMLTIKNSRKAIFQAVNVWLKFAIAESAIPCNPVEMFDKKWLRNFPVEQTLASKCSAKDLAFIKDFLQFSLERHCSAQDDFGDFQLLAGFANPLALVQRPKRNPSAETHREPMPLRLVNQCIAILTENDFAWAKSVNQGLSGSDWFRWSNPETGSMERIWSPVRCYALLIKLMLPARTFQVRMLDSGEADPERYDPVARNWTKNKGRLAQAANGGKRAGVSKGVFHKFHRKDTSAGSLIFFNTNKTADIDAPAQKRGYVMPWEHERALRLFGELRDWQERFNPLRGVTSWSDVPELRCRDSEELKSWGSACFLMRDPTVLSNPTLPITDSKVNNLWLHLLVELERRLNVAGDRLPSGDAIKLTTISNSGNRLPVFDLHSLRVTMITALYEQGVPPEFLAKVAGHASVLMTLYYVKVSSDEITRRLNEGNSQWQKTEQMDWLGHLQKKTDSALKQITARSHDSAIEAFSRSTKVGLIVMEHGFCPMGAQRCADGLVMSKEATAAEKFGAVPDGPSNCARCRFFITGPAFLGGLEARFNDLVFQTQEASRTYESAQSRYEETADLAEKDKEVGTSAIDQRRLSGDLAAYERAAARVDGCLLSLHATYRLIEQCLEIANKEDGPSESGFSLVVAKEGAVKIEAMLEEAGEFAQLNRVCEGAELYEGLEASGQLANARRMRSFDRLLRESGCSPVFSLIENEELALKVANEMASFLSAHHKPRDVEAALSGRLSLQSLGFEKSFPEAIEEASSRLEVEINERNARRRRRVIPIALLAKGAP